MNIAEAIGLRAEPERPLPASIPSVVTWLRATRTDPWYRDVNTVPFPQLANASGVCLRAINYASKGKLTQRVANRLAPYMEHIEAGRLVLSRGRVQWFTPPPRRPQPQPPLVPRADWAAWALCRACSGYRWRPVTIAGNPYVSCHNCLPPRQWPAIGAVAAEGRLLPTEPGQSIY